MVVLADALALIAATEGFAIWALGAVLLGAGTAMVYPTLLAWSWCACTRPTPGTTAPPVPEDADLES